MEHRGHGEGCGNARAWNGHDAVRHHDRCDVDPAQARLALAEAVRTTLNRLDSDGCMSTNDTVILMSSGASGVQPAPSEFQSALTEAAHDIAQQLLRDAEGAQHDIAIKVVNATSELAAEKVARAVSRSNLFKAAIFGKDPNWGRIISAVGTVPEDEAPFDAKPSTSGSTAFTRARRPGWARTARWST